MALTDREEEPTGKSSLFCAMLAIDGYASRMLA